MSFEDSKEGVRFAANGPLLKKEDIVPQIVDFYGTRLYEEEEEEEEEEEHDDEKIVTMWLAKEKIEGVVEGEIAIVVWNANDNCHLHVASDTL